MEALKLYRTGGVLCKWEVEIRDLPFLDCPYHPTSDFTHTGFTDEIICFDDDGEPLYLREYTCDECSDLEAILPIQVEMVQINGLEWFGPTAIHDDEFTIYFFRKDRETGLYYLEPTEKEMQQKDREVQEAAGQLVLPFLNISTMEAS